MSETVDIDELKRRRAVVTLSDQMVLNMMGLDSDYRVLAVRDDWMNFGVRIIVAHPDLPETPIDAVPPDLLGLAHVSRETRVMYEPDGSVTVWTRALLTLDPPTQGSPE